MLALTESQSSDATKHHLSPCKDRHRLANSAMYDNQKTLYMAEEAPLEVKPKINAKSDLPDEEKLQPRSNGGMNVMSKLATAVCVAEEMACECETSAECLRWNMPS